MTPRNLVVGYIRIRVHCIHLHFNPKYGDKTFIRSSVHPGPCNSLVGFSSWRPGSNIGGSPCGICLWWTKWYRDRLFSEHFDFPLPVIIPAVLHIQVSRLVQYSSPVSLSLYTHNYNKTTRLHRVITDKTTIWTFNVVKVLNLCNHFHFSFINAYAMPEILKQPSFHAI